MPYPAGGGVDNVDPTVDGEAEQRWRGLRPGHAVIGDDHAQAALVDELEGAAGGGVFPGQQNIQIDVIVSYEATPK